MAQDHTIVLWHHVPKVVSKGSVTSSVKGAAAWG